MRILGCLEVVEYSLKERFNVKYLHHVSYLRLQDVIGARLSYCCLSGTTPGIISAFARYNWCVYHTINLICLSGTTCVLVVVQYTAVYPVQRVYLSSVSRLCDHRACICQGWVVIADAGCAGNRRILVWRLVWRAVWYLYRMIAFILLLIRYVCTAVYPVQRVYLS